MLARAALASALVFVVASASFAQGWGGIFAPPTTPGAQTGAQECPKQRQQMSIEPTAVDARGMLFESRTLSSVFAYRVEVISGDDDDPNGIVSATAVSGGVFTFVVAPTEAREGNWYQLCGQPEDSNGRKPWGCFCLEVKRTRYARPR